jgi:disulfide bond formation protein DsbB
VSLLQGDQSTFIASIWQSGVMALGLTSLALILMPRRRVAFLLGFVVCASLLGWAYYLQYVEGLDPCPLCIFQRVVVLVIALIFLVGTFHEPGRVGRVDLRAAALIAAGLGAALAARQVWLQSLPKDQVPACGMGLSYMLDTMPFLDTIRRVLEGSGECAEKAWVFLGLSIAAGTLSFFVAIAFVGIALSQARLW